MAVWRAPLVPCLQSRDYLREPICEVEQWLIVPLGVPNGRNEIPYYGLGVTSGFAMVAVTGLAITGVVGLIALLIGLLVLEIPFQEDEPLVIRPVLRDKWGDNLDFGGKLDSKKMKSSRLGRLILIDETAKGKDCSEEEGVNGFQKKELHY
ncbi:hypothetical protein VNO78_11353 [Psophocarpus tetragonolobus]|uniref:Uncharacterized protein n=1 Tax=Psophocarpus tetragonolobus TaxID=3891 RepID=A0AAN9STF8_PSOTE